MGGGAADREEVGDLVLGRRNPVYHRVPVDVGEELTSLAGEGAIQGQRSTIAVRTLFDLLQQHGGDRLLRAFQLALDRGWHGAEFVERVVQWQEVRA